MRIVRTHEASQNSIPDQQELDWIYNGLDCTITHKVFSALHEQLDEHTSSTYDFSRALQAPAMEMRTRGVLVDAQRKAEVIDSYFETISTLETNLERIVLDGVGMPYFNWRSHADLRRLFYDKLGIPPIRKHGRPTTDRNAREKLEAYPIAQSIALHLNAIADLAKKISVLKTEIDPDGRIRTSYNIAGTSTGRFSSSFSEFGTGGNLQNVEESLRSIFISDPGYKFAKFDAKSGESFVVGAIEWNLFEDDKYLLVCESGDPHTGAAKFCWPNLAWTGDLKKDKLIAEQKFYRHHSYRDSTKKMGHGSNYDGKPPTLSTMHKIPLPVVQDFQKSYFSAFSAHKLWHSWTDNQLRTKGYLISLMGRKRWFFGRRTEGATLREAIAYDPQSSLADIVNRAMLKIWRQNIAIVMMQDHDALTFMYPETHEDTIIPLLQAALPEPILLKNNRVMTIPYDCKTGWNKGDFDATKNPDGLKDYHGHDERKRSPAKSLLD